MDAKLSTEKRIAQMSFASVYAHYVTKIEKKGRTIEELHQVIEWLTGYDSKSLQEILDNQVNFRDFFQSANLNSNAHLITGTICGFRIEKIKDEFIRQVRYLDILVDELAKGKTMDKILRS